VKRRIGGILFRHVFREVGLAFVAVALVLLALIVTNQLAFVLGRVADGQVPGTLVLELLRLSVTENASVILPIALLLGITVALGRLYHDSEMVAAQACGMGPSTLYAAAGLVTLATAALSAWLGFVAGPEGARRSFQIRSESLRTALVRGLAPGQFRSLGNGAVLYFREQDSDGRLRDVFFERRATRGASAGTLEIVLADSARYSLAPDGSLAAVVLEDGRRYEGLPGSGAWRTMRFREQTVPVREPEGAAPRPRADMQSLATLRDSADPRYQAEYHWRLATVVITLVLGLLAVPIARLRPRQGRYARVIWVVLLYAVYANLLISGRTLIEKGTVPAWLGLWWVHALVLLLGVGIVKLPRITDALRRLRARNANRAAGSAAAAG
jgi:lipopolysaccharide export system permease protein